MILARFTMCILACSLGAAQATSSGTKNVDDALAKRVMVAVKSGRNLVPEFLESLPDPLAKDVNNLANCKATRFLKREKGKYMVIWQCAAAQRGLILMVKDGKLLSLEVADIEIRAVQVR